jgi:type I restriction enzyme M protein
MEKWGGFAGSGAVNGFRGGFNRSLGRTAWRHYGANTRPLKRLDIDEFVSCYHPANRHERKATWSEASPQGRWRLYGYDQLAQTDKLSLDIFWLKDDSLEDSANLEDPAVIAAEIVEDLRAALEDFELTLGDLSS